MSVPRKSLRLPSNTREAAAAVFSYDLIAEVLSFLPVKSLVQLKSVSKSWNNIISHPTFIKKHLKRSSQNPQFTLLSFTSVVPISVHRLLENPSNLITLTNDRYYWLKYNRVIVGSCNGLLCLLGDSSRKASNNQNYRIIWFRFWNPSIRTISEKLGSFDDFSNLLPCSFHFAFGYDNSTDTYKVVALRDGDGEAKVKRITVRVFSLGDNVWRDIENFPMVPFNFRCMEENCGIYVSNSLNWLALGGDTAFDDFYHRIEKFFIVSLDMRKETYTMMLPPHEFDQVPSVKPTISVLMDCLCFSYDFEKTHFVIWKMTEFGVEKSWAQFLKISYQTLQTKQFGFDDVKSLRPMCLSNGTLILANKSLKQAVLYNLKDNRVERTRVNNISCFVFAKNYIESLVSYC